MRARQPVKKAEWNAVILNADGSVKEDLGCIATYHSNPLMRIYYRFKHLLTRAMRDARSVDHGSSDSTD